MQKVKFRSVKEKWYFKKNGYKEDKLFHLLLSLIIYKIEQGIFLTRRLFPKGFTMQ